MAEQGWEKSEQVGTLISNTKFERYKFLIGGVLMLSAVVYLIISGTAQGAQYFITIDELVTSTEYVGQSVRISGAVIGDSIDYDDKNLTIEFTIVHIPRETDDLALTLHKAVQNPTTTLPVYYEGVKPDLLQDEAQAILTGQLGEDGVFYASELLLKCPSRYGDDVPEQTEGEEA